MDISNLAMMTPVSPPATSVAGSGKATAQGNSLPELGQVRVTSENTQNKEESIADLPASQPNTEQLQNLVDKVNENLQGRFSDLKFTVAEGTDINVVRVSDSETGEIIRQFPSEAMVAIAQAIEESQQGSIVEEMA